jgi:hypothetical protein
MATCRQITLPLAHVRVVIFLPRTDVLLIVHIIGLNDHSYDVEKRPPRTAKPRCPAHDPPKDRISTHRMGVVLRDWSIQFLECCYNVLMKVIRVKLYTSTYYMHVPYKKHYGLHVHVYYV